MENYIPKYIVDYTDKPSGHTLTALEYNMILNLILDQGNYNSEVLNDLFNNNAGIRIPYVDVWLAENEARAKNAYELWLSLGNTGTLEDFLEAFRGPRGLPGIDGVDGHTPIKGVDYFDGLPGIDGNDGYTPIKGVDYFDGAPGSPGADGAQWLYGTGAPDNGGGQNDWFYLQDNGNVWKKITGTWVYSGINIKGAAGTTDYNDLLNKPTIPAVHNINQFTVPRRTGSGSGPADSFLAYDTQATADTIALRSTGGVLRVANPVSATDAVNRQSILNLVYPVGAIYMSVVNTSPATLFGGTWVAWGAGRVPVGVDAGQTEFNTVEETGGAKTHTLTIQELPNSVWHVVATLVGGVKTFFNPGSTSGINTLSSDANQPHNNLQPYITCFMWKRTA